MTFYHNLIYESAARYGAARYLVSRSLILDTASVTCLASGAPVSGLRNRKEAGGGSDREWTREGRGNSGALALYWSAEVLVVS